MEIDNSGLFQAVGEIRRSAEPRAGHAISARVFAGMEDGAPECSWWSRMRTRRAARKLWGDRDVSRVEAAALGEPEVLHALVKGRDGRRLPMFAACVEDNRVS